MVYRKEVQSQCLSTTHGWSCLLCVKLLRKSTGAIQFREFYQGTMKGNANLRLDAMNPVDSRCTCTEFFILTRHVD